MIEVRYLFVAMRKSWNPFGIFLCSRYHSLSREELMNQAWSTADFTDVELACKESDAWKNAEHLSDAIRGAPCMGSFLQSRVCDREHEPLFQDRAHVIMFLSAPASFNKLVPGGFYYSRCKKKFDAHAVVGYKKHFVRLQSPECKPILHVPRPLYISAPIMHPPATPMRTYHLVVSIDSQEPLKAVKVFRKYSMRATGSCLPLTLACQINKALLHIPLMSNNLPQEAGDEILERECIKATKAEVKQFLEDDQKTGDGKISESIMHSLVLKEGQSLAEGYLEFLNGLADPNRFEGQHFIISWCAKKENS